jgi:hypothetical protein
LLVKSRDLFSGVGVGTSALMLTPATEAFRRHQGGGLNKIVNI